VISSHGRQKSSSCMGKKSIAALSEDINGGCHAAL
jgi:hypothetical protein